MIVWFYAPNHVSEIASQRPVPIPVYAEMGSVNPVFILPGALSSKLHTIAEGRSFTCLELSTFYDFADFSQASLVRSPLDVDSFVPILGWYS